MGIYGGKYLNPLGTASTGGTTYISLSVSNGTPYVAYSDGTNSNKATIMEYAGSSTWTSLGTASTGQANSVSLYVSGGVPYVAYQDTSNNSEATVMEYAGSNNWTSLGTASTGGASFISLYVYNNTPYIVYSDSNNNNEATAMENTGGSNWSVVGSAGFSGSSAGPTEFDSLYVYNGIPYAAYQDNNGFSSVMEYSCPGGASPGVVKAASLVKNVSTPTPEAMNINNTYNFPNPCSSQTTIRFSLSTPTNVNIGIYDINGHKIWSKSLSEASVNSGVNYIIWNLRNDQGMEISNGVYLLAIQAEDKTVRKKIAVIRLGRCSTKAM